MRKAARDRRRYRRHALQGYDYRAYIRQMRRQRRLAILGRPRRKRSPFCTIDLTAVEGVEMDVHEILALLKRTGIMLWQAQGGYCRLTILD